VNEAFKYCFKSGEADNILQELTRDEQRAASSLINRVSL